MKYGFPELQAQARLHRDQYEQGEEQGLESTAEQNPEAMGAVPGGYSGALNALRQRHGMERAQASFNSPWDAWYQSVSNTTKGNPVIGGLRNQLKR